MTHTELPTTKQPNMRLTRTIRYVLACSLLASCVAQPAADGSTETVFSPEAAGSTASTIATIATGNPAVGAGVGALVTGVGAWFISKRRKKPAPPVA